MTKLKTRYVCPLLLCFFIVGCAIAPQAMPPSRDAQATSATVDTTLPYTVERLNLPGPVAGVLVKVNLNDPRVRVAVALADDRDPDGDGPCVGQLETTSQVARKHDFDITLNASFFAVSGVREMAGQKIQYFVGNCGCICNYFFSQFFQKIKHAKTFVVCFGSWFLPTKHRNFR